MSLLLLSGLLAFGAHAACPSRAEDVRSTLAEARAAYMDMDTEQFKLLSEQVMDEVTCVKDLFTAADAARVHENQALMAWVDRRQPSLEAAMLGYLASSEGEPLAPDLAARGSQFWETWSKVQALGKDPKREVMLGGLYVDGEFRENMFPTGRAVLVQAQDREGHMHTWYLWGDDTPREVTAAARWSMAPERAGGEEDAPDPFTTPTAVRRPVEGSVTTAAEASRRPRSANRTPRTLAWTAVGAGVLGGAGLGYAAWLKEEFPTSRNEHEANVRYYLNRVTGLGGYGLVGAAGVLGIAACATWIW